jgi:hypothetical protein
VLPGWPEELTEDRCAGHRVISWQIRPAASAASWQAARSPGRSAWVAASVRRSRSTAAIAAPGRLAAATALLAAGCDLLHTHFAARPDGSRMDRSEWAAVVTSVPVARALLLELRLWARRAAEQGARVALRGPATRRDAGEERHCLNAACQWLWVLDSAVQAAQRHHSVTTAEVRLLHAIPAKSLARHRIPAALRPSPACARPRPAASNGSVTPRPSLFRTRPGRRG